MQIAVVLMGFALFAALIWHWHTARQVDELVDTVADLALHIAEREDWENGTFERHASRLDASDAALHGLDGDREQTETAVGEIREKLETAEKRLDGLAKRVEEFDDLAEESVKARIDADKAWAAGVQSIASFGMNIPSIDTRSLSNE